MRNSIHRKILLLTIVLVVLLSSAAHSAEKKVIFAVFWTGCEEVCEGLKDYIQMTGLDAELIIRDVGRDKSKLAGFVQEARALKADVVLTWGTSTTLGIAGTLNDIGNERYLNDIPLVFTLVSDPVRSNIIESYDKTGRTNITGTRNRVPEAMNIKIMRKIKPTFKRLGIIYNPLEANSIIKVNEIRGLRDSLGFDLVALELEIDESGKMAKVSSITDRLMELERQKVDFIYLGSSVFLEDHMEIFTSVAVEKGLPVLSPYETLVRKAQAYISVAAREYDVGFLAGEQITKILVEGQIPGDISVKSIDKYAYVINMKTARKLNLYPPVDLIQISEIVK